MSTRGRLARSAAGYLSANHLGAEQTAVYPRSARERSMIEPAERGRHYPELHRFAGRGYPPNPSTCCQDHRRRVAQSQILSGVSECMGRNIDRLHHPYHPVHPYRLCHPYRLYRRCHPYRPHRLFHQHPEGPVDREARAYLYGPLAQSLEDRPSEQLPTCRRARSG